MSIVRDAEQTKEVSRRHRSDLFQWHVAKAGDFFGDVADVRGLVELAAKRHRRQVRRVRLDQHPVKRYAPRDILDLLRILESDNAGKGNVKAQIEGALCNLPALREAVHDASCLGCPFLTHDCERVSRGGAGMNHKRHATFACGSNVSSKASTLPLQVTGDSKVIQSGLADRDHLV